MSLDGTTEVVILAAIGREERLASTAGRNTLTRISHAK